MKRKMVSIILCLLAVVSFAVQVSTAKSIKAKTKAKPPVAQKTDNSTPAKAVESLIAAIDADDKKSFFKLIGDPQTKLEKQLAQAYWEEAQAAKKWHAVVVKRGHPKIRYNLYSLPGSIGSKYLHYKYSKRIFVSRKQAGNKFIQGRLGFFKKFFLLKEQDKFYLRNVREICKDKKAAKLEIRSSDFSARLLDNAARKFPKDKNDHNAQKRFARTLASELSKHDRFSYTSEMVFESVQNSYSTKEKRAKDLKEFSVLQKKFQTAYKNKDSAALLSCYEIPEDANKEYLQALATTNINYYHLKELIKTKFKGLNEGVYFKFINCGKFLSPNSINYQMIMLDAKNKYIICYQENGRYLSEVMTYEKGKIVFRKFKVGLNDMKNELRIKLSKRTTQKRNPDRNFLKIEMKLEQAKTKALQNAILKADELYKKTGDLTEVQTKQQLKKLIEEMQVEIKSAVSEKKQAIARAIGNVTDNSTANSSALAFSNAIAQENKKLFFKLIGNPETELEKQLAEAYWREILAVKKTVELKKKYTKKDFRKQRMLYHLRTPLDGFIALNNFFVRHVERTGNIEVYGKASEQYAKVGSHKTGCYLKKLGASWFVINVRIIANNQTLAKNELQKAKQAVELLNNINNDLENDKAPKISMQMRKKLNELTDVRLYKNEALNFWRRIKSINKSKRLR